MAFDPIQNPLHLTLAAFAPSLFWLVSFQARADLRPLRNLATARGFSYGCLAAFLALLIRPRLDRWQLHGTEWETQIFDAFVLTALPEELLKFLGFLAATSALRWLSSQRDAMVAAASVALGFASVENVFYLAATGDPKLLIVRAFTATIAHVAFTASLAYSVLWAVRVSSHPWATGAGAASAAVVLHGAYDLFLWQGPGYSLLSLLVVLPASLAILVAKTEAARRAVRPAVTVPLIP